MLYSCFSLQVPPPFFTLILIGVLELFVGTVAVGRFILSDWSRIMLKLANMNEASKKNMMSISGMISIRAFFSGHGEPSRISNGKIPISNNQIPLKAQTPISQKPTREQRFEVWILRFH